MNARSLIRRPESYAVCLHLYDSCKHRPGGTTTIVERDWPNQRVSFQYERLADICTRSTGSALVPIEMSIDYLRRPDFPPGSTALYSFSQRIMGLKCGGEAVATHESTTTHFQRQARKYSSRHKGWCIKARRMPARRPDMNVSSRSIT